MNLYQLCFVFVCVCLSIFYILWLPPSPSPHVVVAWVGGDILFRINRDRFCYCLLSVPIMCYVLLNVYNVLILFYHTQPSTYIYVCMYYDLILLYKNVSLLENRTCDRGKIGRRLPQSRTKNAAGQEESLQQEQESHHLRIQCCLGHKTSAHVLKTMRNLRYTTVLAMCTCGRLVNGLDTCVIVEYFVGHELMNRSRGLMVVMIVKNCMNLDHAKLQGN